MDFIDPKLLSADYCNMNDDVEMDNTVSPEMLQVAADSNNVQDCDLMEDPMEEEFWDTGKMKWESATDATGAQGDQGTIEGQGATMERGTTEDQDLENSVAAINTIAKTTTNAVNDLSVSTSANSTTIAAMDNTIQSLFQPSTDHTTRGTNFFVTFKVDIAKLIESLQRKFTPLEELKTQQRYTIGAEDKEETTNDTTHPQQTTQPQETTHPTTHPTTQPHQTSSHTTITPLKTSPIDPNEEKENIPPNSSNILSIPKPSRSFGSILSPLPLTNPSTHKPQYYSKCSIRTLSTILNLQHYHIILTKKIESDVLKTFETYCNFKLGYLTWAKHTTPNERMKIITFLYRIFHPVHGLSLMQLELILKRGAYTMMQSRLRRKREGRE